jgi:hypothetical protein
VPLSSSLTAQLNGESSTIALLRATITEGEEITAAQVGTTDVDGKVWRARSSGGPGKAINLAKTGQKLNILKRVADAQGAPEQWRISKEGLRSP